tara:strand:+ start:478 stop:771 length:294 start_codon:yes stop_codon:yes gene_type:complete
MSYSRWTTSEFYTFWSGSGASKKEDEEFCCMFSLDSAPHFSYNEVKEMIKNPDLMRLKITDDLYPDHIEELLRYMKAFVKDVDIKYEQKLINMRGGM